MKNAVLIVVAMTLLTACAGSKSSPERSETIFDQYTKEDFTAVNTRRGFVDHIYLEMEGMEGVGKEERLCLGRQFEKHMTDRYWEAVDKFVADHSELNWEDVLLVHRTERSTYTLEEAQAEVDLCKEEARN